MWRLLFVRRNRGTAEEIVFFWGLPLSYCEKDVKENINHNPPKEKAQ